MIKYLIAIVYTALFFWLGDSAEFHVAFIGGIIRAAGATKEAKRMQSKADSINTVRPQYEIPQEVHDYLANATNQAQGDMAGYGRMMDQAAGNQANTLGQARNFADSGTSLLQSLSQADANNRRQTGDVNMQNQQFRQHNFNNMQRALMDMGGYRDQAFDTNEMQPHLQRESDKRQYQQAAYDNKNAAWDAWGSVGDGIVGTAMAIGGAPMGAAGGSMFGKMFGKK